MEDKKILLSVYFLIVVLATPPGLFWAAKVFFWAFSVFVFWIVILQKTTAKPSFKINNWLLLLFLAVLIISRLLPIFHWDNVVPFGADFFVYYKDLQDCYDKGGCPNLLISYVTNILLFFGLGINQILYGFHFLLNILIAFTLYFVTKEYFGKPAAFFSFFLFSISVPQFLAYWAFYFKMMPAIFLTLLAFYLVKKRSPLAVLIIGLIGGAYYPLFFPLIAAIILSCIFSKDRLYFLLSALGTILLTSIIGIENIADVPSVLNAYGLFINKEIFQPQDYLRTIIGNYLDIDVYLSLILIYAPFAVIGLIRSFRDKQGGAMFLSFYGLASLIPSLLSLIFRTKFLVVLDIIAIMLASQPLYEFVSQLYRNWVNKILIFLLVIASVFFVIYQSWFAEPYIIDNKELERIKSLSELETNSLIITPDYLYYPFLYGLSGHKVSDINTNSLDFLLEQIQKYGEPIYIYIGDKTTKINLTERTDFRKVRPNVFEYLGERDSN